MRALSLTKFEDGVVNEDFAIAKDTLIAISDGAGGGGVFADKWSRYLVEHLPNTPILDYQSFDQWIDSIWEPFYNDCEKIAQAEGGMLLNKFYDEGSFATLIAVWSNGQWISYGDSVAFCYDMASGILYNSFDRLIDFNNPPYLINCKDSTDAKGFKAGKFEITDSSIVFVTSDALAHYILMMYKVTHKDVYFEELQEAIDAHTKDSNFIKATMNLDKLDFEQDIIIKIMKNCKSRLNLQSHLQSRLRKGLIGHDDYSLAIM